MMATIEAKQNATRKVLRLAMDPRAFLNATKAEIVATVNKMTLDVCMI